MYYVRLSIYYNVDQCILHQFVQECDIRTVYGG